MDARLILVHISVWLSVCGGAVQYRCDFEYPCNHWHWDPKTNFSDGFQLVTGSDVLSIENYQDGPYLDYKQNNQSHFLLLIVRTNRTIPLSIWSNEIEIHPNAPNCMLQANLHLGNMEKGMLRIVKVAQNISWVVSEYGDDYQRWEKYRIRLGTKMTKFQIVIEIDVKNVSVDKPVHLAVDNLELVDCKPNLPEPREHCSDNVHLECKVNHTMRCLDKTQICDIRVDCDNGEDETQKYCTTVPKFSRCTFESGSCQWTNVGQQGYNWLNSSAGLVPEEDHTYGNYSGHFMYFDSPLKKDAMGGMAEFRSPVFNRLPFYHLNESSGYYNTCHVSFNYKQYGKTVGSLALYVVSLTRRENISTRIFWLYGDTGDTAWHRASVYLPTNITSSYLLVFEARAGFRTNKENFCALDDIVVSPLCFGYGVPDTVLKYPYPYDYFTIVFQSSDERESEVGRDSYTDYNEGEMWERVGGGNYVEPDSPDLVLNGPRPNKHFEHVQPYRFTTCKAKGYKGPNQMACNNAYNYTNVQVQVLDDKSGVQRWRVNNSNFYTILAKGASGGRPPGDKSGRKSNGAIVRSVMPFQEGEKLYIVVGQEGSASCKSMQEHRGNPMLRETAASNMLRSTQMRQVKDSPIQFYGGGGGGGTFLFNYNKVEIKPLIISAGGGGLSRGTEHTDYQHGHGVDPKRLPVKGNTPKDPDSKYSAGAGGGWHQSANGTLIKTMDGHAVESGPNGGESCKMLYYREIQETYSVKGKSSSESNKMSYGKTCGFGGFGGGGGGCSAGGGGGGYSGGDAYDRIDANGQGGFSYLDPQGEYSQVSTGVKGNAGPGELIIIPAVKGCGCSFLCVALDEYLQDTACICQPDLILDDNNKTCIAPPSPASLLMRDIGEYCIMALCFMGFLISSFVILRWAYEIFKHRKLLENRSKVANGFANSDIQLNHLRSGNLLSNVLRDNPTYEFSSQAHEMLHGLRTDLVQIPRENLQLVKALGQGAFGEVYQGLYRQRTGDTVEMPVAVKTLPQVSTSQNEADFLMEACIMQNFKHPNIVRLLGVCFDQHPRYIVIELLAGGDLKNFLRESRPKPERPSPLTVKDLLLSAIDVAKGCKYLEDRRFVHRDIAARNCLLTTKGPGRTVKIADFGMARDIYRNDYYKKGGKAMLPIKWMPPEAFLDGIFSAMTDVWSYGVLLWEIMSLGYMPYTGCANKEVMQLVKGGGRLEPPSNCPLPIYAIMTSCWNPDPEKRPNFGMLLERMDYCLQDPDVVNASLPVFAKPPSVERDQTVMRPNTSEECLNMDYLIPLGPVLKREEKDNSNNTGSCSPTSVATVLDNIPPPLEGNTNDDDCDINDIVDFTNIPPPKEYIDWSPQQAQDLVPTTIITNGLYNDTDDDTEEEEEEDDEEEEEEEEEDETSTLSECRQWNRNPTYPHIKINGDIHDEDTTSVSDLNSPSSSDATASTSTANQNNSNQSSICGNKKPMPSVKFNTKNANGKNGDNEKRPPFTLSGTFVPDTEISC